VEKERVDILAVSQGLFASREKAKSAIMAGMVVTKETGERFDKPGEKIPIGTSLRFKGEIFPYVSRGAKKLLKALEVFDIDIEKKIVLDIGSSTGGFTDVALQHGALLVYALDVGTNQLAWKLRQDKRVVVMEQTNFRYSKPIDFSQGLPDMATIDVSFISLELIFGPLFKILQNSSSVMILIKPQFEAGRELVGKNGIIRDPAVHEQVLIRVLNVAGEVGFNVLDLDFSPITGVHGNIEFIAHLRKNFSKENLQTLTTKKIKVVVQSAHEIFK